MQRVLYVSESCLVETEAQLAVDDIVTHARINNSRLGLTGALLFTGLYFAQILEGPTAIVDELMEHIGADPRHSALVIVAKSPVADRLFPDWQMAYQGPSQFVSRKLERLLHATSTKEKESAAEWITELALEFATTSNPSG